MVQRDAVKIGLLVVGAAVIFFVSGQALRYLSRMLAWAIVPVGLALLGYAAYEVYTGWNDAADNDTLTEGGESDIATVQEQYVEGELSETELEQELDAMSDLNELETENQ